MKQRSTRKTTDNSYDAIRIGMISRGFSLRSFALAHGYNVQTTYDAAKGRRAGKLTTRIRQHLKEFTHVA